MQKVLPLSDRVRAALRAPITSADLLVLIADTQIETETILSRLDAAKKKAVDPLSTDEEASEARRAHHDLGFEHERQTSSVARLKHRFLAVVDQEAEADRRIAYDGLMADHDDLASRLRERYPVLAQEIVDLLGEVVTLNHRVMAVNKALPSGAAHVQPVEHVARGPVKGTYGYSRELTYQRPTSLVRGVELPKFDSMEAMSVTPHLWFGRDKAD